jgi:hypothetical protein
MCRTPVVLLDNGTEMRQKPVRAQFSGSFGFGLAAFTTVINFDAITDNVRTAPIGSNINRVGSKEFTLVSMESLILAQDERWRRA